MNPDNVDKELDHVDKELDHVDKKIEGIKVYKRRGRAGCSNSGDVDEDTGN